jgi:uncharacterized membrane protein SpoIIM required for sporulation
VNARDDRAPAALEVLLDRAERIGRRLPFDDLRELARLYRLCSARLAVERSMRADPDRIRYLNALCVRAYSHLQVPAPRRVEPGAFFIASFPATLAATARLQALSALLMVAGTIAGVAIMTGNPGAIYALLPSGIYPPDKLQRLMSSSAERVQFLTHSISGFGVKSVFSAGLFVHNMQVGMLAFASGILAGVPTLLLDFYTGLMLGGFAWIFCRGGDWALFLAWILPHAIPELLAVTLCSTGGLVMARAVVAPGRRGVGAALRASARPALQMLVAALPLFVVAAGIESFLRQSRLSTDARLGVAALDAAAVAAYAVYVRWLVRRERKPELGWLVTEARPDGLPDIDSEPAR